MKGTGQPEAIKATAEALTRCVARLYSRGWCDGTSGNFSVTLSRKPLRLLITCSESDKGLVTPDDLLVVGDEGVSADGSKLTPSSETLLHVALAAEANAGSVLHTHSLWGTLLGERFVEHGGFPIGGYEMLKGIEGVHSQDEEIFVPVVENTQDMGALSRRVTDLIRERPEMRGFLIAGHGLYTWGRSLEESHRHVEIFEFLFQLLGQSIGRKDIWPSSSSRIKIVY